MRNMRIVLCVLFLCFGLSKTFGQAAYNNYKFVVVPDQYIFQKKPNEYRINTLVRHLFRSKGFEVYSEKDRTAVLDRCDGLIVDLISSGILRTKIEIQLKDCNGNVIMRSNEGDSKEKVYEDAYHEAIKKAFENLGVYEYKFTPKENDKNVNDYLANKVDNYYVYKDIVYALVLDEEKKIYDIIKKDFYATKEDEVNVKVGTLIESSKRGSYVLKLDNIQASAYFDDKGNLVFDVLNSDGTLTTEKFMKQ